ncbi:MAG: VWA domain-containing protein [Methylococcales bacterium]
MEGINVADFHFIRPYWLLALIPAITIIFFLLKNKLNQGNWSTVCDAELLPFILQQKPATQSRWSLSLGAITSLLMIFAIAGPTWERLPSPVFRNDSALVIALDLSKSMDATDIKPSRLIRARFKIADILKQRKDGQAALLVYSGDAFTVTPLTEDSETIISQLSALTTEIMPSAGSNTTLALEKAVVLLKQAGLQSGEILLVTDEVNYDQTIATVKSLGAYHLSILGVGTTEGAPIKIGQGGFLKDVQGNIVLAKLNRAELKQLAIKGKGRYITITDNDKDIELLHKEFDKPSKKQGSVNNNLLIEQWNEKGPWLLLLVLPLAALQFRKGLLSLAFICLIPFPEPSYALEWKDLWQTKDQQAQQAFKQKHYQQAAEQFENVQWKAAAQYKAKQFDKTTETLKQDESATGLYNKGNALAQAGKLAEALEAYKKSLEKNSDDEDAKYNKELVEKQLEKQKQSQQNKKQGKDNNKKKDQQQKKDNGKKKQGEQEKDQQGKQSDKQGEQDKKQNADQDSQPKKPDTDKKAKEKADTQQNKPVQQKKNEAEKEKAAKKSAQQATEPEKYDEAKQANEQWLKRIPDDPAGLLRRKFKYQYGQRGRKATSGQAW